ncbi:MAG: site-specific integrase [Nitrososphaerota archaeon]
MKQRSIERDIQGFCGWDYLQKLIGACKCLRDRGIISGLFITGCRVSELTQLKCENVYFGVVSEPKIILFRDVPVLKRYSRKEKKRLIEYRTFPVRIDEPPVKHFLEYFNSVGAGPLFPYTRVRIFQIVREVGSRVGGRVPFSLINGDELYPHWFRAQRARQLRHDYKFTDEELRDWFGWKAASTGMPSIYGKMSWMELAEKMGVKIIKW